MATNIKYIFIFYIFFFMGCSTDSLFLSDTDKDGVVDYKDMCKFTPNGAQVNKFGCALDQDFDGVIDLYDICPDTTASELVDKNGCTIKKL